MKIILNDTKFYEINYDYVAYLSQFDSQVYCHHKYQSSIKPYIGMIIGLSDHKYFIPLTSAKEKHIKLPLKSREHLIIY